MEIWDIYTIDRIKTGRTIVRGEKLQIDDYHLVVHIWIQNSQGEYLIQKRAGHLTWMPNMWATTGGAVISGEDSLQGVIRETEEELGVKIEENDLKLLFTQIRGKDISYIYLTQLNLPITAYKFEVKDMSEIRYVSKSELFKMIEAKEFVDYGEEYLAYFK